MKRRKHIHSRLAVRSTVGPRAIGHPDRPLVTVLTPTLNRRDLLAETLASVHCQSYPSVEHLVVDGGSTDGTVDLLKRAEQMWGVRWVSQQDGGMYEALNSGFALARGEIIGWVNDDDWLLPWTIDTAVTTMQRLKRPHAVFGDVLSTTPGATTAQLQIYGRFSRAGLAMGRTLAQPTVFWPVSATRRHGPLDTTHYRQIADCEYWLRLSADLPFVKIREILAVVQNHPATKRVTLGKEIEQEFALLRSGYKVPWLPGLSRSSDIVSRRWEWIQILLGRGWSTSKKSRLISGSWTDRDALTNLLTAGPHRRHPFRDKSMDVTVLRRLIKSSVAELQ